MFNQFETQLEVYCGVEELLPIREELEQHIKDIRFNPTHLGWEAKDYLIKFEEGYYIIYKWEERGRALPYKAKNIVDVVAYVN